MNRPYEALLREAASGGRILHRRDMYCSGPSVDDVSEEIMELVAARAGSTVLDVGCGIGSYVGRLQRGYRECVGVDVDEAVVRGGRRLGRNLRPMSADALEFPDATFDTVLMIETLEHLSNPEAAIAEARRVAKTNLIVTVPDASAIPLLSARLVVPWHMLESSHVNFFTPAILRQVLVRHFERCETGQLGQFFEADSEPVFMHAWAVAWV